MKWFAIITGWLFLSLAVMAENEQPSLEMLIFLAEFTDEQGDWNGPSIEEALQENETNEGEQND